MRIAPFEIAKGSFDRKTMTLADTSKTRDDNNETMKIYQINSKEYKLNLCAIIEGVNDDLRMDELNDVFEYGFVHNGIKKDASGDEHVRFDVLVYGRWRGDECGMEVTVMLEQNVQLDQEMSSIVWNLTRQLLGSTKVSVRSNEQKESLMACLDCGRKLNSKDTFRKHCSEAHEFVVTETDMEVHDTDVFLVYLGGQTKNQCHLSAFKKTEWIHQWMDSSMIFLVPFTERERSPSQTMVTHNSRPDFVRIKDDITTRVDVSGHEVTKEDRSSKTDLSGMDQLKDEFPRMDYPMNTSTTNTLEYNIKEDILSRVDGQRSISPSSRHSNRHGSNREYRCNICNYKTITKGNLHIHFQSEKHRNNQREHDQNEQKSRVHVQDTPSLPNMAAMPQLHLFDSLLSRTGPFFSNIKASQFSTTWAQNNNNNNSGGGCDLKKDSSSSLNPLVQGEHAPMASFECDICHNYSHQDADVILEHAERPRPLPSNSEVSKVVRVGMEGAQGTELEHLCLLDGYKTRIKANFLLHFKTEKHQQKLQLLAHAREGGLDNANKIVLQMVTEPTPLVNIRCSLCRSTFSTAHKLRLHVDSSDHQINHKISVSFRMWQKSLEDSHSVGDDTLIAGFECKPCGVMFRRFIEVLDHFQNQRNNIHMAFFKKEVDINSLVKINYFNQADPGDPVMEMTDSGPISSDETDVSPSVLLRCYLCNDAVNKKDLRIHLKEVHKSQENCVDQLIKLTAKVHSEKVSITSSSSSRSLKVARQPNDWCDCVMIRETESADPMVRCQHCGRCFCTVALLEEHKVVAQHTEIKDPRGHLCYKKGCNQYFKTCSLMIDHFYEIHTLQIFEYNKLGSFKYTCKVCHLLAFSDPLKFTQHVASHSRFNDLDCTLCGMVTESRTSLRLHIDAAHVIDNDNPDRGWKSKERQDLEFRVSKELSTNVSPTLLRADSQSSFSSPESIINKENRSLLNHFQGCSEQQLSTSKVGPTSMVESAPSFLNSWASVASLIQAVGLENVKLVIETMINSKCEQNEKDSLVWRFAESIINVANIQETLVEKCDECGKMFSCQSVLRKHTLLCSNASADCLSEFERIVSLCRDHLTRMMLSFSTEPNRKPLFISINSHSNDSPMEDSLIKLSQQCHPQMSRDEVHTNLSSKLPTSGFLNFNRSMFHPMLNPYRFPQSNHSFLNILPPLGMFPMPQFRFSGHNSNSVPASNLNMFTSKIPISSPTLNNNSVEKIQDPLLKCDNFNRKRTQIKNYQYEILRSYFNINNPPNDETISEIITRTGLDKKTVKHWFRNTLFKERQRCKDSPYNFNIPPETSLNLEEYEKTGKVEIKSECARQSSPVFIKKESDVEKSEDSQNDCRTGNKRSSENGSETTMASKRLKSVSSENNCKEISGGSEKSYLARVLNSDHTVKSHSISSQKSMDTKMRSEFLNLQSEEIPLDLSYQTNGFNVFNGSRSSLTLDPISPYESEQEPAENSNSMCGERRHRTTLTAMQIQAMKSIFIHCRSPTHGELAALGNFLSLDMRVVQVWFQNQRAKLKKQERDMFYREKPIFPEAIPSVVDLPKCDRSHCLVCNQNLSPGVTKQSHLFSTGHLTMLMRCLLSKSHDMKINWKSVSEANSL